MATIPDPAHQQVASYTVLVNSLAQVDMQSYPDPQFFYHKYNNLPGQLQCPRPPELGIASTFTSMKYLHCDCNIESKLMDMDIEQCAMIVIFYFILKCLSHTVNYRLFNVHCTICTLHNAQLHMHICISCRITQHDFLCSVGMSEQKLAFMKE